MNDGTNAGKHSIDVRFGAMPPPEDCGDEARFDVLVIADLHASAARAHLADRRPVPVDRDVFDEVLAGLGVACDLDLGPLGGVQTLRFGCWDDFHPDAIVDRLPAFHELRTLRAQAQRELAEGARRIAPWGESRAEPGTLAALLESAVREHLVAPASPRKEQLLRCVEQAMEETLRWVMAQPALCELETTWSAIRDLVRSVETGPALRIHLLHATCAELEEAFATPGPLGEAPFPRALARAAERASFRVVLWPVELEPRAGQLQVLSDLALVAGAFGAALVSGASPAWVGAASWSAASDPRTWGDGALAAGLTEGWRDLRASEAAQHVALFAPRTLVRLPYGAATDPIERFPFEELAPGAIPKPERLRYASGAWIAARLLARGFARHGPGFPLGEEVQVDSVPMHVISVDGEPHELSASESVLRESALEPLLARGINAVVGYRGEDRLRVASWRSLHVSGRSLRGAWRG